MKSEHQQRVEEFMRKAGQDVPEVPTVPNAEVRRLRAKLILEEALETIKALGVTPLLETPYTVADGRTLSGFFEVTVDKTQFGTNPNRPGNLIEVIDGCCDISVVTMGTLSAFGIPDAPFLKLVDESNLAKFAEGSYRREDGKWMKPPGWKAPDIAGLLKQLSEPTNTGRTTQGE